VKRDDVDRLVSALDHLIAGLEDLKAIVTLIEADDEGEATLPPPAAPEPVRGRPDGLLTVRQAAETLRCHPDTVRNMISRGQLAAVKIGNRWLVDGASLPRPERVEPFAIPPPRIRVPRRSKYGDDTLVGQARKREREARGETQGGGRK